MKAHYFRTLQGEYFLVPEEHIQGFDKLSEKLESGNIKERESAEDEFNDKYWQYKQEGDFYSTKLFVEKKLTSKTV